MLEVIVELLRLDGLVCQQILGQALQLFGVFVQNAFAALRRPVEDGLDLLVDDARRLFGIALHLSEVASDEDAVAGGIVEDGPQTLAHAVAHDHVARQLGRLLDIARCAGRDVVQEELFCRPSAQRHHDVLKHLFLRCEVFQVLLRTEQREAAGRSARDDRDIVDRVHMRQEVCGNCVSGFVIGGQAFRPVAHLAALLLRAHLDLEDGLVDVLHRDEAVLAAYGQQGRLVHQVFQVSAREARCALGNRVEVDIVAQLLVARMDFQDGFAPADVRQAHIDLAVKAAGTQQRVIQNVGTVGCRHDDDALVVAEAVHLHQQLVERLFALVVAAAETAAALSADGVDLVDKDDGRGHLLGLVKQVADTACTDADVQLDKVRAGDGQELNPGFSGDCLGKQRLAGSRRADQQDALGNPGAHIRIGLRVLQKVDDFGQLFFFLVTAGHIGKGLLVLLLAAEAGPRLAEACHTAGAAAHAVHHDIPQRHRAAHQDQIGDDARPPGNDKAFVIVVFLEDAALVLLLDQVAEVVIENVEAVEVIDLFFRLRRIVGAKLQHDLVAFRSEGLDLFLFEQVHQVGIMLDALRFGVPRHGEDDRCKDQQQQDIKPYVAGAVAFRIQIRSHPF